MDAAAPLLCAGITVYTPLKDNGLIESTGKKIGVVGLGGLGHVAVKFAKAFGHHVTIISTSPSKEKEAKQHLGADDFILSTNPEQMQSKRRTLDFILDTVSAKHSLGPTLELLKVNGTLVIVGAPDKPMDLPSFPLIFGCHGEDVKSQKENPNVSEEYNEAFRTKSYMELCNKVEDQLETRMCTDEEEQSPSSSPSLKQPHNEHLSEYLLDPPQETLTSILKGTQNHQFVINYLDKSQEASRVCELVLQNVLQASANHHPINNITNLIKQTPDPKRWTHHHYDMLYKNLASFARQNNPFQSTPDKFLELHDSYIRLLHQLTSKYKKKKRRTTLIKHAKRGLSAFMLVGSTALAVSLLVLATNSVVCVVAGPGLIACCLGFLAVKRLRRQRKRKLRKAKARQSGVVAQLDVAARGVYTLINDLDTLCRLVGGLHDEVERRKLVVGTCVERGRDEMVKEVVRELQADEPWFLEEVEELKRHVCLCFLNINRARRLLVQEIV